jgi:hypothetical protein
MFSNENTDKPATRLPHASDHSATTPEQIQLFYTLDPGQLRDKNVNT